MRGWEFLPALLLAACATTQDEPVRNWLVGTWLRMADDLELLVGCDSGLPIHYAPDGTYLVFEGNGTWRLQGERLVETALDSAMDEPEAAIGVPIASHIHRIGPDEFRRTNADGSVAIFRRCPPA